MKKFISLLITFHFFCLNNFSATISNVTKNADPVQKYKKFELTFSVTTNASNLYDPNQIDVYVTFSGPNGSNYKINCFPYQNYIRSGNQSYQTLTPSGSLCWKCRFAPPLPGTWTYTITATDGNGTNQSSQGSPFSVINSTKHGFIRVSSIDKHYFAFDDGAPVFLSGENIAWDNNSKGYNTYVYDNYIDKLKSNGANLIRLWMCSWAFGIEWNDTGLGNYGARQNRAWALDYVLDKLEENDMYAMLCLINHGQFNNDEFGNNPYNSANGGPLPTADSLWSNSTAQNYLTRRWRYITARWGYATSVLCYELFNEIENTTNYSAHMLTDIPTWHSTNAAILKNLNPQWHLITTSFGYYISNQQPTWANLDFTNFHQYNAQDMAGDMMEPRVPQYHGYLDAPTFAGEMGTDWDWNHIQQMIQADPTGWNIHNCNWSSLMCKAASGGLTWWWDLIVEPQNQYFRWKGTSNFVANEDLDKRNYNAIKLTPANNSGQPLRAYCLQGHNRILGWVQNANHTWYGISQGYPIVPVSGATLTFNNLLNGQWKIEWWDTVNGTITDNQNLNITNNTVTITIPQIDSNYPDRAFKLYNLNDISSIWRINSGGSQYVDSNGFTWLADTMYVRGSTATNSKTISNTNDPTLFNSERWGNFSYVFRVPAGIYSVLLKFAETTFSSSGQRVFDVSINNVKVLDHFDIFAAAGGANTAIDRTFNNITPNDRGEIILNFGPAYVDAAKIDAIQIQPQATFTPTFTPSPTFTPTQIIHNAPGKIECENYMNGANGTAYYDTSPGNQFNQYRNDDVDIEICNDTNNGYDIGEVKATEWLNYLVNFPNEGYYNINFRVACLYDGGNFHLEIDNTNITGSLHIPDTGGWQNWTTVSVNNIFVSQGQHTLKLSFDSNGVSNVTGNFNFFELILNPTPTNTISNTATFTATNTRTNTSTFTRTFTSTSTFTQTFTLTKTATLTFTNTATDTETPVATSTRTSTFTNTNTETTLPTSTFTHTQENTLTSTYTFTSTPTNTFTQTILSATTTFTHTQTETVTSTQTATNSITFTSTFTATPSFTTTFTLEPTTTHTFTSTHSLTSTPTFTNTQSLTTTPTFTNTQSFTAMPSQTFTKTPTFSSTFTHTQTLLLTQTPTQTPFLTQIAENKKIILNLFPIPAKDKIKILMKGKNLKLKIFTVAYRMVYNQSFTNKNDEPYFLEIYLKNYSKGIYYICAENEINERELKTFQILY